MEERGDVLTRIMEEVMGWALALMVVLVFGNVVLRYGFNSGISISEELSRYLFVGVTFVGAVAGLRRRQHLGVEFLVLLLPRAGRTLAAIAGHLVMLLCCAALLWGSIEQMRVNMGNRSVVMEMPLSVLYGMTAFCGLAMGVILLASFFRLVTGRSSADDLRLATDEAEQAESEVEHINATAGERMPKFAEGRK